MAAAINWVVLCGTRIEKNVTMEDIRKKEWSALV
jgi:hypothetical protein